MFHKMFHKTTHIYFRTRNPICALTELHQHWRREAWSRPRCCSEESRDILQSIVQLGFSHCVDIWLYLLMYELTKTTVYAAAKGFKLLTYICTVLAEVDLPVPEHHLLAFHWRYWKLAVQYFMSMLSYQFIKGMLNYMLGFIVRFWMRTWWTYMTD